ncbi:putative sporulation-specific glycosylase YdhD [termite gut metagenome]|uniref:Putative sporulation-specific glycosylase YdhD n=1 Tax=termite gut metagenome TaxID=433724 RepID=A0A5J4RLA6_9ZZZZ
MKITKRILLLFLLFVGFFFLKVPAQQGDQFYFLHTVEKGQELHDIASMYGISRDSVVILNPGSRDRIYAGQKLKIPQKKDVENKLFHTIQPGETLYRLTLIYKVPAKAILDANPGLKVENFQAGKVLLIPTSAKSNIGNPIPDNTVYSHLEIQPVSTPVVAVQSRCKMMHQVKRGETVYSISRDYGITSDRLIVANPELKTEKLKRGSFICIPYPPSVVKGSEGIDGEPLNNENLFVKNKIEKQSSPPVLKVAIILPFLETESRTRMVEYYEGFLMAVDSLKRTGVSIDLYVYDSGGQKTSISLILRRNEMKEMDIIFGPLYQQHIKPLADFAKTNKIRLVLPFTSKNDEVFTNPYIYQINVSQSYLYPEIYEYFTHQFRDANIIIIETGEQNVVSKRDEFIKGLKQELQNKSFTFKTLDADVIAGKMETLLSSEKNNILIPTSDSNTALLKLISQLTTIIANLRLGDIQANVQLFGYPEWQTYVKDHISNYFDFDTYFYSSFYTNNLMPDANKFSKDYRKWYSKETLITYPRYGMLGYDTGLYFLKGLSLYGSELEDNLPNIKFTPLQMDFKFQRVNNWGGFINKNVFFVHFTKDYEIRRINCDRFE